MKVWMWPILAVVGGLLLFFLWATYPWNLSPKTVPGVNGSVEGEPDPNERPTTLTVLTWNMAYAYGMGSEGTPDYSPKDEARYKTNLDHIASTIKASGADVVLLQEIDFDSSRSHNQDQLLELAKKSGLRHWSKAESWRTNYVPFPPFPINRQYGGMSSGGAVLSRWPIKSSVVELLPKPASKAWWYNLFYLYRYFQIVTIQVGDKTVKVLNLHLEAFDLENKAIQAKLLIKKVASEKPDLVAGDFNMIPDGAIKRSAFTNPNDRYEGDNTFGLVTHMPYKEVVEMSAYLQKEDPWFTFPSERPDRRLDYVFFRPEWVLIRAEVFSGLHPEVSDHLPLKAVFKFFDPEFIRD